MRALLVLTTVSAYLSIWKKFDRGNAARIPPKGPVIFVANHTTAYDPLVMQAASKHRLIHFMMAKEYYEMKPFVYLYRALGVIPATASATWWIWSGVVPQQPPTILTRPASANSPSRPAMNSGLSS